MTISVKSIYNWYHNTIQNPKYRWWIILGTLVYLLSPIDIVPDFLPIVGEVDDIMLLTLLITEVSQVVLDYAKSRKHQPGTYTNTKATTNQTIDVESVSFK